MNNSYILILNNHPLIGLAAIPFLKKYDGKIVRIVGTGQGAFSAGLIASGRAIAEIEEALLAFWKLDAYDQTNYLGFLDFYLKKPGFFRPDRALYHPFHKKEFFRSYFGDLRVEELPIPLSINTTDLFTSESYLISSGNIVQAVYASSAWFPMHPPEHIQGRLLANGAFSRIEVSEINTDGTKLVDISIYDPYFFEESSSPALTCSFFDRSFLYIDQSIDQLRGFTPDVEIALRLESSIPRKKASLKDFYAIEKLAEKLLD